MLVMRPSTLPHIPASSRGTGERGEGRRTPCPVGGQIGTIASCDTIDTNEAIDRVQRWMERLDASATAAVGGILRSPQSIGAQVETLCFDGPAEKDWPALAIREVLTLFFSIASMHLFLCRDPLTGHQARLLCLIVPGRAWGAGRRSVSRRVQVLADQESISYAESIGWKELAVRR